jgi:hypothetical protein
VTDHHHRFLIAPRAVRLEGLLLVLPALLLATACGGGTETPGSGGSTGSAGTGGSGGSGGSGGAPSEVALFQAAFAEGVCSADAKCCTKKFDQKQCLSSEKSRETFFPVTASATTGAFDAKAAAACLTALTAASGQCATDSAQLGAAMDVCQTVFAGTKKVDEPCEQTTDCAAVPSSTRYCNNQSKICEYSPITIVSPLAGPCANTDPPLGQPHYVCDGVKLEWCNLDTSKCESPVAQGEVCGPHNPLQTQCAAGLICLSKGMNPGTCVPAHAAGDACDAPDCDFKTDPMICACGTGTSCDYSETKVCNPVALPGEECPTGTDCAGLCSAGSCVTRAQYETWAQYCLPK